MVWHQKISPSGLPKLEAAAAEVVPDPAGPCGTADSHQAQQTPDTKNNGTRWGGERGGGIKRVYSLILIFKLLPVQKYSTTVMDAVTVGL